MKKTYLLLSLSLLFLTVFSQTWVQRASFPSSNSYGADGFSLDGKGYVVFGNSGSSFSNYVYEYDPIQNSWIYKSAFPGTQRASAFAFVIDSFAYIGGGYDGSSTYYGVKKYDPRLNVWSNVANYAGSGARNSFSASINGKGYVGGGAHNGVQPYSNQMWEYSPTSNSWSRKANLPYGSMASGISIGLDSLIYLGLGHNGSSSFNQFWAFDPSSNTWAQMASFPGQARIEPICFEFNGKIVVGGGRLLSSNSPLQDYYEYNPINNTWSSVLAQSNAMTRSSSTSFSIGQIGYVVGGLDASNTANNEVWTLKPTISNVKSVTPDLIEIFKVFPNPSNGILNIQINRDNVTNNQLEVYSIEGKLIFSQHNLHSYLNTIDISYLKQGVYFIRLTIGDKSYSRKISIIAD